MKRELPVILFFVADRTVFVSNAPTYIGKKPDLMIR